MTSEIVQSWQRFWFRSARVDSTNWVRITVGCITAVWFISFVPSVPLWFGENGLLPAVTSARLLDFAESSRWQLWSPLWWTENLLAYYSVLLAGCGLSLCVAAGFGGRLVIGGLIILAVGWIHRTFWLNGPFEPALIPMLIYLAISPGTRILSHSATQACWQANVSLRMLQVHLWLLIAAGLLSQLAGLTWWRGEAIWWLAASGRSTILSLDTLGNRPATINLLTHAVVVFEVLTLWFLTQPVLRRIGVFCGWAVCLTIALFWCQYLYAALLAAVLLAYWHPPQPAEEL